MPNGFRVSHFRNLIPVEIRPARVNPPADPGNFDQFRRQRRKSGRTRQNPHAPRS